MKVGLLVTCLVDLMRPRIGFAAIELLEAAGCEVAVPAGQTCCGQPGWNAGDRAAARGLAEKLVTEFEACDYVVAPSGSCSGMVKTHYPELFRGEAAWMARVDALAAKTHELTDFLVRVAKLERAPGDFAGKVTYHDSCSGLRELGVKAQPRALLATLPEAELVEMKECETCCGFGGTFSVKHGDISSAMADVKCRNAQATGADALVLGDLGCMLNLEGRLRKTGDDRTRVLHVAEVLTWKR